MYTEKAHVTIGIFEEKLHDSRGKQHSQFKRDCMDFYYQVLSLM